MMRIIRIVAAVVAGMLIAFVGAIAAELFSAVVHPFPADFDSSSAEEMQKHVANYPHWVLAAVVPIWGFTALISTWVAGRIGAIVPAMIVAVLLVAAVVLNISLLPYPIWFEIVIVLAVGASVAWTCRNAAD